MIDLLWVLICTVHLTAIESNDEDGDALYQDQKLIISPSKKHTESRPGNGTGYLLSPLFKSCSEC